MVTGVGVQASRGGAPPTQLIVDTAVVIIVAAGALALRFWRALALVGYLVLVRANSTVGHIDNG